MIFNLRGGSMARSIACTNVEVFVTAIRTHYLGYVNEPLVVPCFRSFGQRAHTHNDSSLWRRSGVFCLPSASFCAVASQTSRSPRSTFWKTKNRKPRTEVVDVSQEAFADVQKINDEQLHRSR